MGTSYRVTRSTAPTSPFPSPQLITPEWVWRPQFPVYIHSINVLINAETNHDMLKRQHELNLQDVVKAANDSPVSQHNSELICSAWVDSTPTHLVCDAKHVQEVHAVVCTGVDSCREEPTRFISRYNGCIIHFVLKIAHPRCTQR